MRPVWIWGQPPHLLQVVGEAAFPVIQVEGQFDSLTVALGDEEVQGESGGKKKKKKFQRLLLKQQSQCKREGERWREKLVIHQQGLPSGWEGKIRSRVVSAVGNELGLHDLSFLAVVNWGFGSLSKD